MKGIVTVGLGFGDEGKGATVDFLVRERRADLVVRYSGGAQAGHRVVLPDGRSHSFSQFGAGTLAGVRTWIGPRTILSPATLHPEANHLKSIGVRDPFALLEAHPDCLLSTHYHVCMNRLREIARGGKRHGSCGLGIGEARRYWLKHGLDAVVAGDLRNRTGLVRKLTLLRDRMLLEMQDLESVDGEQARLLYEASPAMEADLLCRLGADLRLSRRMPEAEVVVFEGAQGILLDEYYGFHPHTTWSTVTSLHARELAEEFGIDDLEVLGITRAYSTRHGAGPLPTHSMEMTAALADPGNPRNDWQGAMRAGPLDLVLLAYAAASDRIDGIAVNGLDHLSSKVRVGRSYRGRGPLALPRSIRDQSTLTEILESAIPVLEETTEAGLLEELEAIAPVRILGRGPSFADRQSSPNPRKRLAGNGLSSKFELPTPR
jgi:adenylosuccinate synthase